MYGVRLAPIMAFQHKCLPGALQILPLLPALDPSLSHAKCPYRQDYFWTPFCLAVHWPVPEKSTLQICNNFVLPTKSADLLGENQVCICSCPSHFHRKFRKAHRGPPRQRGAAEVLTLLGQLAVYKSN